VAVVGLGTVRQAPAVDQDGLGEKLGRADRIIHRVNDENGTIEVVRIDHRSRVYRPR
jgi:hypothetical protein